MSDEEEEEDDDEEDIAKMEGLSPSDAIVFPLLAGSTLAGLYFLIKYMGAATLNKFLGYYFSALAIFSVAKLVNDSMVIAESFIWPRYYLDSGSVWHVRATKKTASRHDERQERSERESPLPGMLGRINLSPSVASTLWILRGLLGQKYLVRAFLHPFPSLKANVTLRTVSSLIIGLSAILYSNLVSTPWWLTNVQGFAFSYSALQLMSPTTFTTGSMILVALFFYDIYFVFYTPMMVTVASNLDVPIKLLFPRPSEEGQDPAKQRLAMLGLGDVVLPGIMIGLALRFDLYLHYLRLQKPRTAGQSDGVTAEQAKEDTVIKQPYKAVTGLWGDRFWTRCWSPAAFVPGSSSAISRKLLPRFRKTYFYASIMGYVLGMCFTLGIMQVFKHAQPALLYLVPGVLGSLWLTALLRGEVGLMWEFSEAIEEIVDDEKEEGKKTGGDNETSLQSTNDETKTSSEATDRSEQQASWMTWLGESFFGNAKSERNAKRLEKSLSKTIGRDGKGRPNSKNGEAASKNKSSEESGSSTKKEPRSRFKRDSANELIFFSVTRIVPRSGKYSDSSTNPVAAAAVGEVSAELNRTSSKRSNGGTGARSGSDSSSEDAVLVSAIGGEVDDTTTSNPGPKWRGSGSSASRDEGLKDAVATGRSEKRQRTR